MNYKITVLLGEAGNEVEKTIIFPKLSDVSTMWNSLMAYDYSLFKQIAPWDVVSAEVVE